MIKLADKDLMVTIDIDTSGDLLHIQGAGAEISFHLHVGDLSKLGNFLEKVRKGAKWWNTNIEWQSDDQRLTLAFGQGDWIDITAMPMMPDGSPWTFKGVVEPDDGCLSDAIGTIQAFQQKPAQAISSALRDR